MLKCAQILVKRKIAPLCKNGPPKSKILEIEALRIVLAARWNYLDLLEIRVQRNESRRRIEEWHKQVWLMLEPAVVRSQFAEWPLKAPMKRIALEAEKHSKIYEFRDAGVLDKGGDVFASFQTFSDQGNLFKSHQTLDAINGRNS